MNHESVRTSYGNRIVDVPAGGMIISTRKLAEKWGWSKTKCSEFLHLLESLQMIKLTADSRANKNGTLLTVVNWAFFQDSADSKRPYRRTSGGQYADRKAGNTILNKIPKEIKEDEKKGISDLARMKKILEIVSEK